MDYKRYLITSALPYANGPVHIGHLAGVYVPSDIYVRYLRQKGKDVKFICGSDEHGVPITIKARKEGVSPQAIVDRYHELNKSSFERFGISFDIYSRTSNKVHHETAGDFFKDLYQKGEFVEQTSEQYYDKDAGQFLADRYIKGTCPHCNYEEAYGDQCEQCGTSLSPMELINPHSMLTGNNPVKKETTHWYLPLDQYEGHLRKWILEDHKEWKSNVYGQCKSWLDDGLKPRAVTRDLDWGVPVPVEGADGKVLYVWFDAPIGYISATKELTPDWEKYWKDEKTKLVHFIGKDNIVFHCIIFPSMLHRAGNYILPDNVPANEFLNLEGNKISTSRNWAVWLHEYLEEFPGKEDVLRYTLTANMPETKDNDFSWADFQARNNNELVAILGNFVNRALVLTHKYYNGEVPEPADYTEFDKETIEIYQQIRAKVEHALDHYRFREALREAMNLARLGNKYLADTEPWKVVKSDEARTRTIMYVSLQISAALSVLMEPFIPFSAQKLNEMVNAPGLTWQDIGNMDLLKPGHKINKAKLLFEKVDDVMVANQRQKLDDTKKQNEAENADVEPSKAEVKFEDFTKMDIRVGTILDAEKVKKTKKLLKMTVDTGIDQRTVVSGIAEYFTPEDVVGRQVSILVNLAPRKIRGIESQGMILMAQDADGSLRFVQPSDKVKNGSMVN